MRRRLGSLALSAADSAFPTLIPQHGMWDDREGGILAVGAAGSSSVGSVAVIKEDGHWFHMGKRTRTWNGAGWSFADELVLTDNVISRMVPGAPFFEITKLSGYSSFKNFALMSDRLLRFDGNKVTRDYLAGGATQNECIILSSASGPGGRIFPADLSGGRSLWWLATPSTGALYLYDAAAMAEVSGKRSSFGGGFVLATYSRKKDRFGVFMSTTPTELTMFANESDLGSISVPLFGPGTTSVSPGRATTVECTVLGSDGEAVIGRNVTFATAGGGEIRKPTVPTNSAGLAQTEFRAFGPTGSTAVTATLVE